MKEELFITTKDIKDTKIAILADIHYCPNYNKKVLDKITKQIKKENPQYLLIAGDILDQANYDYKELINFFNNLNKDITIIAALGNHDCYYETTNKQIIEKYNDNFINEFKALKNTYLLNDEILIIDNICFYGIDLSFKHYYGDKESYSSFCQEIANLKTSLDEKNYNITIIHSPVNIYNYIKKNPNSNLAKSNLIISGHTHNGILPYWFTNILNRLFKTNRSLVSPYQFIFPKYAQGRVYKPVDGIIYEGLIKLSNSSKFVCYFDFIFHKKIKIINIKKK